MQRGQWKTSSKCWAEFGLTVKSQITIQSVSKIKAYFNIWRLRQCYLLIEPNENIMNSKNSLCNPYFTTECEEVVKIWCKHLAPESLSWSASQKMPSTRQSPAGPGPGRKLDREARLQSMELQRVGRDRATNTFTFHSKKIVKSYSASTL